MISHLTGLLLLILNTLLPSPSTAWEKRTDAHGKTIIAYYASWQWYDRNGLAKPTNLDHSKVTRYNFAFFQINSSGDIWGTDSWADPNTLYGEFDWSATPESGNQYCSWNAEGGTPPTCAGHNHDTGLIGQAHGAGVEVYPSIGGWTLSDSFPALANNPVARQKFASNCVGLIEAYDFDGIDIDWEYPGYAAHSGTPDDTVNYSLFLREIRDALDELGGRTGRFYGLTAALPCGPDLIRNIQVDVVSNILTELNLMTYDFHGSWNAKTGINAPLFDMEGSPEFSVDSCVKNWEVAGGSPDQINIGLPFYGRSFAGIGLTGMGQAFSGNAEMATWHEDGGSPQYFNLVRKLGDPQLQFTTVRDVQTKTQYAYNKKGLVSYDDELAICDKTEYAMDNNLNGYIIWEISGDLLEDLSTPLLDAMDDRLNNPSVRCDGAISDAMTPEKTWYPNQQLGFCVNDGNHLENFIGPSQMFESAEACCESTWRYDDDCVPSSLDPSYAERDKTWYPNQQLGFCANDGKQLENFVPSNQMFESAEACCESTWRFDDDCVSSSLDPSLLQLSDPVSDGIWVDELTVDEEIVLPVNEYSYALYSDLFYPYYNDEGTSVECRNDGAAPSWINRSMMKSFEYGCCKSYFFPSSWEQCISDHPFYPNFKDKSCVNDGRQPEWMAGDYFSEAMWECCQNFYQNDEELLQQCTGISSLGCDDCSISDYLTDFYADTSATAATVAIVETISASMPPSSAPLPPTGENLADFHTDTSTTAAAVAMKSETIPASMPPSPAPLPLTSSGGDSSTSNYCGNSWRDANSKCATPCPGGIDEECPTGEKCYADSTVCVGVIGDGGSGPCGSGNVGNGICDGAGHCCSQYGWCGSGPTYCSDTVAIVAGGAGSSGPCGEGNVGNGVCDSAGHCCSQYGWCGSGPKFCSNAASLEVETVTAATEAVPAAGKPAIPAPVATQTVTSATGAVVSNSASSSLDTEMSLSAGAAVESVLDSKKDAIDRNILTYQSPTMQWEPSSVYRYSDLVAALRVMYNHGVANKYFYVGDDSANGHVYGLVNLAAFLAQSMKETIKYNACDENSWDLVGAGYPLSNACGQLGQSYQDYTCSESEKHMECPVKKEMTISATTNAKWWGAPAPLFCGPKSKFPSTGFWDPYAMCGDGVCDEYEGQKGGDFVDSPSSPSSSGRTDVEGCCWWGRGVIQTTGVCNFGKLNYYLGAKAAAEGRDARYPDIDFCETPDAICGSDEHKELKWIAGMFYWVESVQSYAGGWDYITELHNFVDNGMSGNAFIDAVSGIVNRGCHNPPCTPGSVDGGSERSSNFITVLTEFGLV